MREGGDAAVICREQLRPPCLEVGRSAGNICLDCLKCFLREVASFAYFNSPEDNACPARAGAVKQPLFYDTRSACVPRRRACQRAS